MWIWPLGHRLSYPASGFDSLVNEVWKGFPGDETPGTLCHIEFFIFKNDPALTDDYNREATALHFLKDIHLHILQKIEC